MDIQGEYLIKAYDNLNYKKCEKKLKKFLTESTYFNLFSCPDFLRYHLYSDNSLNNYRFYDLIIENKLNIFCHLPGAINDKSQYFESHIGSSFSGPCFIRNLKLSEKYKIIDNIIRHFQSIDIKKIIFRIPPSFYFNDDNDSIEELEFLLYTMGFSVSKCDLNVVINLKNINRKKILSSFSRNIRRNYKVAESNQLQMKLTTDINTFYSILEKNREKFKVKPTHTLMNLEYIKSQFPNHVLFFLLFKENIPIAGLCSFQVTKKVLNVFYLCHEQSSEANKPCDYLMVKFIDWAINNEFELIDLGPNNLNYEINYGLLKFKMGFNGITKIRKRYQLLIS